MINEKLHAELKKIFEQLEKEYARRLRIDPGEPGMLQIFYTGDSFSEQISRDILLKGRLVDVACGLNDDGEQFANAWADELEKIARHLRRRFKKK